MTIYPETKICTGCDTPKSLDEFYKRIKSKDGKTSKCKGCLKGDIINRWTHKTQEEKLTIGRRSYENTIKKVGPVRYKEHKKNYNKTRRHSQRGHELKRKYGITNEGYDQMLAAQNGKCGICPLLQKNVTKRFCVDHCHITGKVRGLLCSHCNTGIGYLKDSIPNLKSAIKYLS